MTLVVLGEDIQSNAKVSMISAGHLVVSREVIDALKGYEYQPPKRSKPRKKSAAPPMKKKDTISYYGTELPTTRMNYHTFMKRLKDKIPDHDRRRGAYNKYKTQFE